MKNLAWILAVVLSTSTMAQNKTKKVEMYRTLKVEVERISTNTDNAMQAASDFIANKE